MVQVVCEVFGERFPTFAAAWRKYGKVPKTMAYQRFWRGNMSVEDCLTAPVYEPSVPKPGPALTVDGVDYPTIVGALRALGNGVVRSDTFAERLRHLQGRTVKQAATLTHRDWLRAAKCEK